VYIKYLSFFNLQIWGLQPGSPFWVGLYPAVTLKMTDKWYLDEGCTRLIHVCCCVLSITVQGMVIF